MAALKDSDSVSRARPIYIVASLPRSGHHAFVNNLAYSLKTAIHVNHARELEHRPGEIHSIEPSLVLYVRSRRLPHLYLRWRNVCFWRTYFAIMKILTSPKLSIPLVYSFENGVVIGGSHIEKLPVHDVAKTLYFLRDPFNWLASLKTIGGWGVPLDTWVNRWIFQASYVAEHLDDPDALYVSYNAWVISEDYRRQISTKLNLPYTAKGVETVSRFGGGSSFGDRDITRIRNESQNRWRKYADDPEFRRLVSTPKLMSLSRVLFGEITCDPALGMLREMTSEF